MPSIETHQVTQAYRTQYHPYGGSMPEEVLVLDDGRAVYLNTRGFDVLFTNTLSALDYCVGTPCASRSLTQRWKHGGGYVLWLATSPNTAVRNV